MVQLVILAPIPNPSRATMQARENTVLEMVVPIYITCLVKHTVHLEVAWGLGT